MDSVLQRDRQAGVTTMSPGAQNARMDVIWPSASNVITSIGSTTYCWSPASVVTRNENAAWPATARTASSSVLTFAPARAP